MSKKLSSPPQSAVAPAWFTIAIVGLFGLLLGATVMYFAMRPRQPASTITGNPPVATNPDPTTHLPAPELTAGQTPAQADRTLGNFYYDHQNWPLAVQHYQAAIRQGNDDADIRTDLGNAYRFSGRPDDALAQYVFARNLNPNHEFSLFNQGGLYLDDLKQPGRAVEIWQEYLVRFPNGQNVEAARQLIARAQGGVVAPASPATSTPATAPAQTSQTEDLILRQIQATKTKSGQP
ncbi:MAG TPA: tetratricopeptide repeat protein [Lacunisphaera sp.]